MSIQRTPTYDKSHYSWQPPSSQASESLISGEHGSPGGDAKTPDVTSYFHLPHQPSDAAEQDQLDSKPGLPRRSTFNYKHSADEFKKQIEEETHDLMGQPPVTGRRGSITGKPFKPSSKRTKSWDYRDKRGEMQMHQLHDQEFEQPSQGFSET
ncbi:hypothetical protein TWF730_011108 [Orbilia blumenaviensis]|uniref:Uncharacterized protein n=1 Tax=Orbilia blumenaviensis TaxID=1796055 RepID=A0AAV9UNW6_9PEZI